MSGGGEHVARHVVSGELVPPAADHGGGRRIFEDFVSRLRGYVAPPPPGELGWQAAAGAAMMLGSAGLLWLLPSGHSIVMSGLLKWAGRAGLASTLDSAAAFPTPLALLAVGVLCVIAAIYLKQLGAQPALIFLTAQVWLGVLALTVAGLTWLYLLTVIVVNLVIWAAVIVALTILAMVALSIIGGLANG